MTHTIRKVALVGCGIMGSAIGGHVLDAGFDLTVHTRTRSKAEGLLARGARWAATPAQAAAGADAVLTMVGYPSDVEDVYLGTNGILEAAPKGAWLVDLTTSSPELARELHDAAEVMDKHAFDCPVTGGDTGARAGTLTLIAGTTEAEAAPVRALLDCFSAKIVWFGRPGTGQAAKLCNQVSLAACMMGYAEALSLAEQEGVDPQLLLDVLNNGTGGSGASRTLAPRSLAGDYKPGFQVEHLRKDLGLALAAADDAGINLPACEDAHLLFDAICRMGGSRMGTQALTLIYSDGETCRAAGLDPDALEDLADMEAPGGTERPAGGATGTDTGASAAGTDASDDPDADWLSDLWASVDAPEGCE